jgi:hypothetical protein
MERSKEDQSKFDNFIETGKAQLQEIDDIRASLRDQGKAIAEELGEKPKLVMKALKTAYKNDLEAQKEEMATVEAMLNGG